MKNNKYDGLMEEVLGLLEDEIPDDEIPIPEGADTEDESDEGESDDAT
jgi:hypothetical protein